MSVTDTLQLAVLLTLFTVFTAYTMLDVADHVFTARDRVRTTWLVGGAVALGSACVATHVLALLSFAASQSLVLDALALLAALALSTTLSGMALLLLSRPSFKRRHLVGAGSCLGLAVITPQVVLLATTPPIGTGITQPVLHGLPAALAATAALSVLRVAVLLRGRPAISVRRLRLKLAGATAVGLTLAAMHATSMAAVPIQPVTPAVATSTDTVVLGGRVVIATVVMLALVLLTSLIDRLARQTRAADDSRRRYESLVEHNPHAVLVLDGDGHVLNANGATERMLGYAAAQLQHRPWIQLSTATDRSQAAQLLAQAIIGAPQRGEIVMVHRAGRPIATEQTLIPIIINDAVVGAYALVQDITARKQHEATILELERKYREIVDNATDLILTYDGSGEITFVNRAFRHVTGYVHAPALHLSRVVHADDLALLLNHQGGTVRSKPTAREFEFRLLTQEAETRYMHAQATPINQAGQVVGVQVVARDMTERKLLEQQLTHQAFHDPLTELPNRSLFLDRLEHALARTQRLRTPVALLFLDLDRFKVVNDSLGHGVGDRLLVGVARRLQGCVRPGDTVARLGGDEFTILLEEATVAAATHVAARIIEALQTPFTIGSHEIFVNTSIGVVVGTVDQDCPEDLLRNADIAMYHAKQQGKGRYAVFEPSMNERAWARLELEYDLRRAIDRHEFCVYYQPEVELASGRVIGMEALVRWQHPERGLVPPAEFIPLAEETGLIIRLGHQVLAAACRQARAWQLQQPTAPLVMHVNLSARQFQHPLLVEEIAQMLQETGLDPAGLDLEITESVVMEDVHATIDTLRALKQLGVRLAIDDFGTGYSSLAYLQRFPVDIVKIDRTFVQGLGTDTEDTVIVGAMIGLAHALGLRVIAEGVETPAQLARLRELGCNAAQGYYFGHPAAADTVDLRGTRALTASALPTRHRPPLHVARRRAYSTRRLSAALAVHPSS